MAWVGEVSWLRASLATPSLAAPRGPIQYAQGTAKHIKVQGRTCAAQKRRMRLHTCAECPMLVGAPALWVGAWVGVLQGSRCIQ